MFFFFFQAEDGIRDAQESRGLGDVYKRQCMHCAKSSPSQLACIQLVVTWDAHIIPTLRIEELGGVLPSYPTLRHDGSTIRGSRWVVGVGNKKLGIHRPYVNIHPDDGMGVVAAPNHNPVSYTHLTLPTKRIV
eukprot:TRINITY_DN60250_c0_g1_i1.p1 TRINITY_DN60250_c0_g1~~TRINITY_DN60250_c0_g1_i1.p1  ORF type:complete len:133 (-),score=15.67 TRINITY_DN60250_c0_g1_i1:122-520(-)